MNPQNGTNSSIYGLLITGGLTAISHIAASDILTWVAIIAALTTIAVNTKNFIKKEKQNK